MTAARTRICIFNFTINYNSNLASAPTASYYVSKTTISKVNSALYAAKANQYFPFLIHLVLQQHLELLTCPLLEITLSCLSFSCWLLLPHLLR